MSKEIKDFIPFCKDYILDHIDDYEEDDVYACDLGWTLTEGMNLDGTFTYSREEAINYLKEWWWDAAEYFNYEKDEFGCGGIHNPFDNPEAYTVSMVIEGINGLLGIYCDYVKDNWNEYIQLTQDVIDTIKSQIEKISDDAKVF